MYDLQIEGTHEFVANGLIVHNTFKGITGIDGLTAFQNSRFTLRAIVAGLQPRAVISTTPKRIPSVRQVELEVHDPAKKIHLTRGSLLDNAGNLDVAFKDSILDRYANTALGSQEIDGVLAKTVEGALFTETMLDATRIRSLDDLPNLSRPIVAVDPSSGDGSGDLCGITVLATSAGTMPTELKHGALSVVRDVRHIYVLEDASIAADPDGWANRVVEIAQKHGALEVVAESNQGGLMVASLIKARDLNLRVKMVPARVGKEVRAQPVAGLFSQHRMHIIGEMGELEDELCGWVPGQSKKSPDRLDSMVHGARHLEPSIAQKDLPPASSPSAYAAILNGPNY